MVFIALCHCIIADPCRASLLNCKFTIDHVYVSWSSPYQLLHVSDGFAALKMVRTLISQLILLDYLLPDMDGLECLDRL